MSEAETGQGLFASLRQLLATAVEMLRVRLALLSTEIEQEKLRLFDAMFWAGFALLLLGAGVLLLSGFVLMLFWDSYRLIALAALALAYLGTGAWLMQRARLRLSSPGGLFNSSVTELARDRRGLERPE